MLESPLMNVPAQMVEVLPKLDEEIFFALLDVALDIDSELTVTDRRDVQIGGTRVLVRYPVLCPGVSVGAMCRYVDLRRKGLTLLEKFGFICFVDYRKYGLSGFEGNFVMTVSDSPSFPDLLTLLRAEENRRNPSEKMQTDISGATARLVQLADSFHRVILQLRNRRAEREPLLIKDEYDV